MPFRDSRRGPPRCPQAQRQLRFPAQPGWPTAGPTAAQAVRKLGGSDDRLAAAEKCLDYASEAACDADTACEWSGPGLCLPSEEGMDQTCEASTQVQCGGKANCSWDGFESVCYDPVEELADTAEHFELFYKGSQSADFGGGFKTFKEALACEKATNRSCRIGFQDDDECQVECLVPSCLYDGMDCCDYFEVECGTTRESRAAALEAVKKRLSEGSWQDDRIDFSDDLEGEQQEREFADRYDLSTTDIKDVDFKDMDKADQEEYSDSPEAVDSAFAASAEAMAKSMSKAGGVRSIKDLASSLISKARFMVGSLKVTAAGAVKRTIANITRPRLEGQGLAGQGLAGQGLAGRRLAGPVTLTEAQLRNLEEEVAKAVEEEGAKFMKSSVDPMQLKAIGVGMLESMRQLQQTMQKANNAFGKAEYLLGAMMGVMSLKTLFPLALGILSGLSRGITLVRGLLPATVVGGYLETIIVAGTMPMFAAYLATLFQIVGISYVIPAFILLLCYLAIPGTRVYWYSRVKDYQDPVELGRVNFRITILQNVVLLAALFILGLYAVGLLSGTGFEKEFVKQLKMKQFLVAKVIVNKLINMASLALVTCISAADVIFSIEGAVAAHNRKLLDSNREHLDLVMRDWSANLDGELHSQPRGEVEMLHQ